MDILDELAERFAVTLDSRLCSDSDYLKAMLMDTDLLQEALRDVKYMCGESLYESCY